MIILDLLQNLVNQSEERRFLEIRDDLLSSRFIQNY